VISLTTQTNANNNRGGYINAANNANNGGNVNAANNNTTKGELPC